ncbi:MAG TPA: ATP-binding cassette domain-containing protein, partial [Acidobacteriota bacterium]|nr:ATP-binding cassette domain-containing protein [Acidobacteriota bacterium]
RVRNLLTRVGMESSSKKMPSEISGGMQKRVGLARALVLDPSILLLDEPTAGLDPITASEITDLVQELREEREVSAIVVTHDMRTVHNISDHVAMLHNGKIVMDGTFEDLQKSDNPFVSEFIKQST